MLISSSVCLRTVTFSPTAFWSVLTVTQLNEWERRNCRGQYIVQCSLLSSTPNSMHSGFLGLQVYIRKFLNQLGKI